jgi:hypothetical protein
MSTTGSRPPRVSFQANKRAIKSFGNRVDGWDGSARKANLKHHMHIAREEYMRARDTQRRVTLQKKRTWLPFNAKPYEANPRARTAPSTSVFDASHIPRSEYAQGTYSPMKHTIIPYDEHQLSRSTTATPKDEMGGTVRPATSGISQVAEGHATPGPGTYDTTSYDESRIPQGGRFSKSRPKSSLEWVIYRAANCPGPGEHDLTASDSYFGPRGGRFSTAHPKSDVEIAQARSRLIPGPGQCKYK